ncbi:MAG: NAD(P)H-dependent oxidoreductase [Candidatus Andersenbacteria bacterium]
MKQDLPLSIVLLLGTVRRGRRSEAVAAWLKEKINQREDMNLTVFDPLDMNLPMDHEGEDLKEQNPGFKTAVENMDALIIVSPEYNHSYPGSLKRALDILFPEYARKAVGLVSVSKGNFGGVRMLEHLHALVHALGLIESKTDLMVPNIINFRDEEGVLHPTEDMNERLETFLNEVTWLASSLRWGRQNI